MATVDDLHLTPEQRVNKLFRTAVLCSATLERQSDQWPNLFIKDRGGPWRVEMAPVSRAEMSDMLRSIMDDGLRKTFEESGRVEFSHAPEDGGKKLRVKVSTDGSQLHVAATIFED